MDEQLEIQIDECDQTDSEETNNNNYNNLGGPELEYAPLSEKEKEQWTRYRLRANDSVYPPNWPYPTIDHDVTLSSDDPVKYPSHYNLFEGKHQVIDLIKDRLTPEEYKGYLKGNMIKYHMRAEHKNGLEDYKKMQMYLQWLIINEENSTDV